VEQNVPPQTNLLLGTPTHQVDLGERCNHVSRGGVSSSPPPPGPGGAQANYVAHTRKKIRPMKPIHNPTAAPKPGTGDCKKKAAANVKTPNTKHTAPDLEVLTQRTTSTLQVFSDLIITFASKHVWSRLVGSSRPNLPPQLGQVARGLP
jgi:hypothetical protein